MRGPDDLHQPDSPAGHALVVAGGSIPSRAVLDAAWPGWADDARLVIAADSGWLLASSLGLQPDVLVGDLDSLDRTALQQAEAAGTPVLRFRPDKDESDTELALLEAVRRGVRRVTVLGALGGPRLDHALANVWLLAHPALAGIDAVLLDERTRVSLLAAPGPLGQPVARTLSGRPGAVVSLLPLGGDAWGITTDGLAYALRGEPLRTGPARGISNVRTGTEARVTLERGRLLILELAGPAGSAEPAGAAVTAVTGPSQPRVSSGP
jgi:thiamine pyrophosphokinase